MDGLIIIIETSLIKRPSARVPSFYIERIHDYSSQFSIRCHSFITLAISSSVTRLHKWRIFFIHILSSSLSLSHSLFHSFCPNLSPPLSLSLSLSLTLSLSRSLPPFHCISSCHVSFYCILLLERRRERANYKDGSTHQPDIFPMRTQVLPQER